MIVYVCAASYSSAVLSSMVEFEAIGVFARLLSEGIKGVGGEGTFVC